MYWLLLTACVRSGGVNSPALADRPDAALPFPGLKDVACADTCRALVRDSLVVLPGGEPFGPTGQFAGFDGLHTDGTRWWVSGPCDGGRCEADLDASGAPGPSRVVPPTPMAMDEGSLSFADGASAFTTAWNAGIAAGWRSGFHRVILGPGGGRITWLRGIDGAGQLVRAGAGTRTVRLGATTSAVSWPAWLALHPTGLEAYLVAWPSPTVRAFDPATLEPRWTVSVEGAAQGLFVDPNGRWLVVGVGGANTERLIDWDIPAPSTGDVDPNRDEALRGVERPPMTEAVVIDIATKSIVARAPGNFRRFVSGPRPVLATDRALVYLTPGELPS